MYTITLKRASHDVIDMCGCGLEHSDSRFYLIRITNRFVL